MSFSIGAYWVIQDAVIRRAVLCDSSLCLRKHIVHFLECNLDRVNSLSGWRYLLRWIFPFHTLSLGRSRMWHSLCIDLRGGYWGVLLSNWLSLFFSQTTVNLSHKHRWRMIHPLFIGFPLPLAHAVFAMYDMMGNLKLK